MKIQENVTVFKCDHCNKKLFRKHAMANHEKWCNSNPVNIKACIGCKYLVETKVSYMIEGYYGEEEKSAKAFKCSYKDKLVYPTIVEKKGLVKAYPETFEDQEPMPVNCEFFDYGF